MNTNRSRVQQAQQQFRFRGQVPPAHREPLKAEIDTKTNESVATLRIFDVIDSWGGPFGVSAKEVAQALDELGPNINSLDVHLNSPGGEALEGIAILNLLRAHPAKVTVTVDGLAASAASFIAAGADETVMARNSQMMIHDAWGLVVGNAEDMRQLAGTLDKLSDNIASIYADKAGGSTEDWRGAMRAETWYTADEAVQAGLANSVLASEEAAPSNSFDLSVFAHAGRTDAPAPFFPASPDTPESPAPAGSSPVVARHLAGIAEGEAATVLPLKAVS